MSKNRYVNTHFWDDNYVIELDPSEKLLFLYFLTNPLTNIAGCYEINLRQVALHTGYDREMILKILVRFEKDDKIIYRDGWVLLVNSLKHQSLNPNIEKGIEESLQKAPDWIKAKVVNSLEGAGKGFERLYKALKYLNTNLNLNTNPKAEAECVRNPGIRPDEDKFVNETIDGIKKRLRVTFSLPNESIWQQSATWALVNGFTPEQFLKCYDYLKSQSWREGRITPDTVKNNLPEYVLSATASSEGYVNPHTGKGLK